ncbi:MAG: hypothetical protein D6732_22790 [Methanobacteriota archaeon]|nr:MAG: hypothetical protein D6732_22790 [Euryarchaeota archaeon]
MKKVRQVGFDISQGQGILLTEKFQKLQSYFISNRFLVQTLRNRLDLENLDQLDLLVILYTTGCRYSEMEKRALINYVRQGGNLLLLAGELRTEDEIDRLNELVKEFGIQFKAGVIYDPSSNFNQDPSTILVMPTDIVPNPPRVDHIIMQNAIAITTKPQQSLLITSPSASGGMQTTLAKSCDDQRGKVIVVGSLSIFEDSTIGLLNESNRLLLKKYVDWLVGEYDPLNEPVLTEQEEETPSNEPETEDEILSAASQKLIEDFMKEVDVEEISSELGKDNFNVEDLTVRILRAFLANAIKESKEIEARRSRPILTIEGMDQIMLMLYNINKTLEKIAERQEE